MADKIKVPRKRKAKVGSPSTARCVLPKDHVGRIDKGPAGKPVHLDRTVAILCETGRADEDALRRVQLTVADHLIAVAKGDEALNYEVAYAVGDALRDLARGYVRPVLEPQRQRGSPRREYAADNGLAHAALYLRLVEAGEIEDPAPTKRIAEYFGIRDGGTVRRWKRDVATASVESFWGGVTWNDRAVDSYHEVLRNAGENYRKLSGTRSTGAIKARATKPQR